MAASSGDAQKWRAWQARFARYRSSGLSVSRFCQQDGVSTNTFYYWAKRLRLPPAPARCKRAIPPRRALATARTAPHLQPAVVRFCWKTGMEVWVPADCLEAIRSLADCFTKAGEHRGGSFQEVVVRA